MTVTVIEALKSAQYIVDHNGRRTAVLLPMQAWQSLLDWIDNMADTHLAADALTALQTAGRRPERAGRLAWDDISAEWGEEDGQDMSLSAFEKDWDNPEDAIYDNWRELYGVPAR